LLKSDLDFFLLQAIDESLSSLGEEVKSAVHLCLERLNVRKREIPLKTGIFTRVINELLGSGASVLEFCIAKRLYEKIGMDFNWKESDFDFNESLRRACAWIYKEFVTNLQRSIVVFSLEDWDNLDSFRLVVSNAAGAKLLRMPMDQVCGKTITEVFPKANKEGIPQTLVDVMRSNKSRDLGTYNRTFEDGSTQTFIITAFPLSSNCVGLALKNIQQHNIEAEVPAEHEKPGATHDQTEAVSETENGGRHEIQYTSVRNINRPAEERRICEQPSRPKERYNTAPSDSDQCTSVGVSVELDWRKWTKFHDAVILPLTNSGSNPRVHVEVRGDLSKDVSPDKVSSKVKEKLARYKIEAKVETKKRA